MNYSLLLKLPQSFTISPETCPYELFITPKTAPVIYYYLKLAPINYSLL